MNPSKAQELAKWCDANSSGIYRPSAEAAALLRTQDALLRQALLALDIWGNAAPDVQQDAIEAITEHLK